MLEQGSEAESYTNALVSMKKGDIATGLNLLHNILSKEYDGILTIFEYDSMKNNELPETIDKNWIHAGDGKVGMVGKQLHLVIAGGKTESVYEHDLDISEDGIMIDFVMQRSGGGEENCHFMIDTKVGSDLIRFNQHHVHLSSNHTTTEIDFSIFHAFRLIMENRVVALIIDGKLSLFSIAVDSKSLNKIVFGCTRGLTNADVESAWTLFRISHGKNILNKVMQKGISDIFLSAALKLYDLGRNAPAVRELSKLLLFEPQNQRGIELLYAIMTRIKVRDPAVYLLDELIDLLNNPNLSQHWKEKRSIVTSHKIIEVEDIGVKFLMNMQSGTLAGMWDSFFSRNRKQAKYFWALQNVSFSVMQGEIVGIIGLNGSGKSTLLRVIAKILTPDEGAVKVNGNPILLAPGMAFREELSGRENIYLGCLFMGMKKKEIDQQFDNIVRFAELEDHIDRTFKYYSDGMKSRLNFAVATHLRHDILLLDELLGAGDVTFNRKAAKRMEEMVLESKTAVVVTHSTEFVREHCTKAIYLQKGRIKYLGDPDRAVDMYLLDGRNNLQT